MLRDFIQSPADIQAVASHDRIAFTRSGLSDCGSISVDRGLHFYYNDEPISSYEVHDFLALLGEVFVTGASDDFTYVKYGRTYVESLVRHFLG